MRQLIGTTYMLSKLMVLSCGHKQTQGCLARCADSVNQAADSVADSARRLVKRANGYIRKERRDKRTQNA
jgi:hypothetical protein